MSKYTPEEIEQKVISMMQHEKTAWGNAVAFVTDKIAFDIRELVKQLRRNYWGIFSKPTDSSTGKKKVWVPLTESICEAVIKEVDIDTKDINFRNKRGCKDYKKAEGMKVVAKNIIKNRLDDMFFGEYLDKLERTMSIDGTAIWKTIKKKIDGKTTFDVIPVDRLNFFIDPTAKCIQEADVIERALITPDQFQQMDDLINTDNVKTYTHISRTDPESTNVPSHDKTEYIELYERWGLFPLSYFTGKRKDEKTIVQGQAIVSNLDTDPKVHLLKKNTKKIDGLTIKPYEEAWFTKVDGRWDGRGPAEKVMMLQLWLNIIVNIRINRSYVSQLGIFKIRKNTGTTGQMLKKLAANGVIEVDNMDDVQQLVMQEASQASYNDETNIQSWAQRVTSAFQIVTGEAMPASTTATVGAIQNRSARSSFVLVKEGLGMFIQRWIKRHVLPIIQDEIKKGYVETISGEDKELAELDEKLATGVIADKLGPATDLTTVAGSEEIEQTKEKVLKLLKQKGKERQIELTEAIDFNDYEPIVYVTNEEIDKGVMMSNLISALQMAPEFKEQVMQQLFDLMGVEFKKEEKVPMMPEGQQEKANVPAGLQETVTKANTMSAAEGV